MSDNYDVSFSDLPEKTFDKLESGVYILKITEIIKEDDPEYGSKYTMTHEVVGTGRKINYDNYKLFDASGKPEVWGQGKLRALLEALDLTNLEKINVAVLNAVAKGEMFKAQCDVTDKGYVNIHFADIYPLSDSRPALNPLGEQEENAESPEGPQDQPSNEVADAINDDDI